MSQYVEWELAFGKITKNQVTEVENEFNVKFPQDYVKIVMEFDGATVNPNVFDVQGIVKVFGGLLSFTYEVEGENIVEVYKEIKDGVPSKVFPFASDPAGNYICFDYRNAEQPKIVFWEHEQAVSHEDISDEEFKNGKLEELQEQAAIFYVADSFSKFLTKLYGSEK